jgi:hypothetical protein
MAPDPGTGLGAGFGAGWGAGAGESEPGVAGEGEEEDGYPPLMHTEGCEPEGRHTYMLGACVGLCMCAGGLAPHVLSVRVSLRRGTRKYLGACGPKHVSGRTPCIVCVCV